jgi:hypothetical protein
MSLYIQYHNVEEEGLLLAKPPFSETNLGIHTHKSHVPRGGIVGRARPDDVVEEHSSPWFFGPYGFVLAASEVLPFVRSIGKLGFFEA